jgi:hypothetical protein
MKSSRPRAGGDNAAVAERNEEAFEAAVRRRMTETGLPEKKARFASAIEWGILPDGDVIAVDEDSQEPATNNVP